MKKLIRSSLSCLVLLATSTCLFSSTECLIADATVIDISSHKVIHDFDMPTPDCKANFGPSGIVYHPGLERLIVISDKGGQFAMMKTDGSSLVCKTIKDIKGNALKNRDHEAVTYANSLDGHIYVAVEDGGVAGIAFIRQVNLESARVVKTWKIKFPNGVEGNKGLESLTFVSDPGHSEGGTFIVGDQTADIALSHCDLPIKSGGDMDKIYQCSSKIDPEFEEVSGLDFVSDATIMGHEGVVFVSSDRDNVIAAYSADGKYLNWSQEIPETSEPGQEGHAFNGCMLFVSSDENDKSRKIHRYSLK